MRKALVVGINHYDKFSRLFGCAKDAKAVREVLEHHGTVGEPNNFEVMPLVCERSTEAVKGSDLHANIKRLFQGECETALLYFAGHGHIDAAGGYLLGSDAADADHDGIPLSAVLAYADGSGARNRIIILDSCHSGAAGTRHQTKTSELKEGTTILTASTADQYASEKNGGGVFTSLLVDALRGAAANLVGEITPGSVYAHIDQSLGAWSDQRPVFKTNVKSFVSLRKVTPPLTLDELRGIKGLFPSPRNSHPLDPTYEPERENPYPPGLPDPVPAHTEKFAILQKYNRVNLVVPVDAPHMWHAAMGSTSCRLTPLGRHYRRLVEKGRI